MAKFAKWFNIPNSYQVKMPVNTSDIIELLCTLSEEENLRVTISESLKGGIITGGMAAAGGLILGPMGLAIGGTIGGCLAAVAFQNRFLPAVEVIATMQPEKRDMLAQQVRNIMANVGVTDIAVFAAMITGDVSIRSKVIFALVDYLKNEMSMAIVEH